MYYVYSLKCKDGYYIGCTKDLKERVERHRRGQVPATKERLPINIEFYIAVSSKNTAYRLEKYLKSGNGRLFIKKRLGSDPI